MRKVVNKFWGIWSFDKEEQWLNEMAAKGWSLVSVGFCKYEFEETEPGEYGICLQLLENNIDHPESQRYIEFLEETGAEHIGTYLKWIYLRKKKSDGQFKLFSDNESRVKHLTLVIRLLALVGALNLWFGTYNVVMFFINGYIGLHLLGLVNLVLAVICTVGLIKLLKKRKKIKNEQQVFE